MSNIIRNWVNPIFSALDFDNYPPSVANLPIPLTINGQTVLPNFRYNGKDAVASTWAPWGYGETLTLQAGTAPTYNNGSPLLGSIDDSVKFNAGGYYQAGGTSTGNFGTNDFVIEIIGNLSLGGFAGKGYYNSTYAGWNFSQNAGTLYFEFNDGTVGFGPQATIGLANEFSHLMLFGNRDEASNNGCVAYRNGVLVASTNISAKQGNVTNVTALALGFSLNGGAMTGNTCYIAMYNAANWHKAGAAGPAEWATIAATRFAQLTGVYAQKSNNGVYLPTAATRTTTGYLDKVEADGSTKLYLVGPNWPRVCSRADSSGVKRGLLVEAAIANSVFPDTGTPALLQTNITIGTSDTSLYLPGKVFAKMVETNATGVHAGVFNAATPAATALSVLLKQPSSGGRRYAVVTLGNDGGVGRGDSVIVDLQLGTLSAFIHHGGTQVGIMKSLSLVAPGEWLLRMTTTSPGNNYAPRIGISTDGTSLNSFTGDPTTYPNGIYYAMVCATIESYPSSFIATVGSPVTRTVDTLRYNISNNSLGIGKGDININVLAPNYTNIVNTYSWLLSDGTNNNRIGQVCLSNNISNCFVVNGGSVEASFNGSVNRFDGNNHVWGGSWRANLMRQIIDGNIDGTDDTTVNVPTSLTQLDVGNYWDGSGAINALVSKIKIAK